MTETEYKEKQYPQDFIMIKNEIFPLPKGSKIEVQNKEIANTFTTADGTIRKDIIRRYKSLSIKFAALLENDFKHIHEIIQKVEQTFYGEKKEVYLKKETMPSLPSDHVFPLFECIKIDTVSPIKYSYAFRKNGLFVYSGVALKIN